MGKNTEKSRLNVSIQVTLLYGRLAHIVNQLYFNKN